MTKYFIADLHYGHSNVRIGERAKYFPTQKDWDEGITAAILERVGKGDTLFILGDMTMDNKKTMARFRSRLVGDVWLIRGNHDPSLPACRDVFGKTRVRSTHETKIIGGHKVFMSHYPHAYWPSSHRGSFHVYGHMHGQREGTLNRLFPGRRAMDVGCENIFRTVWHWGPISEYEIVGYLGGRGGHDNVKFYEDLQGSYRSEGDFPKKD